MVLVSKSDSQFTSDSLEAARPPQRSALLWGAVLAAVLVGGSVSAQALPEQRGVLPPLTCDAGLRSVEGVCVAIELPANAYSTNRSFGRGWECQWGYTRDGESCAAVVVPENGYLDASGDRWRCGRGFREIGGNCAAIMVPENGFLASASTGSGWACERGYRATDTACSAIEVPQNGYLEDTAYGTGWRCERGFRATEERCDAVVLPANAHLDYSGTEWECDPPYRQQADACLAP